MTIYEEAIGLMQEVREETKDIRTGVIPSPYVMMDLYGKLVDVYMRLSEATSQAYRGQVQTYLDRRIAQAKSYKTNRLDEKMTAADAERTSLLAVGTQFQAETEALAEYEGHKTLARAVDKAIEFCRSMASFVKSLENRPTQ